MTDRILIVQLADIGDLVLSTPALAALRQARPDAYIALLTTSHTAVVVQGTGLVNEVMTLDREQFNSSTAMFKPANLRKLWSLRAKQFDTIVYFHHFTLRLGTIKFALIALMTGAKRLIGLDNGNGWFLTQRVKDQGFGIKHQTQYWLDLVGLLGANTGLRRAQIAISEADRQWAENHKLEFGEGESIRVAVHAGSGGYSTARRWDAHKFAAVADMLQSRYKAQVVLVGGASDNTQAVKDLMTTPAFDLAGQTSLGQLAATLEMCDLFIGADSGVMHIAAAVGTPVVAVFGPSNQQAWSPWTPDGLSMVVRSAPECSPCSYVHHTIGLRHGCVARTCMRMVTAGDVLAAARAVLQGDETVPYPTDPMLVAQKPFPHRVKVLGLPVDAITYSEWLDLIAVWIEDRAYLFPRHVCTINPEFIMIAQRDVNFYNILSRANLCVPDGVGLLWAAKYLRQPLPERVTGSDGVPKIAERAAREGWTLFLLGAAEGIAEKTAAILRERYPGVQIVGTHAGSPSPDEEDDIVERVNITNADILFVAYGAPEQDKWIARNLPRLNVQMAMGVGGAFDFIAGIVPRAPEWMRNLGIEWLYRLYLQPSRIGRMTRLPRFVLAVLRRGKRGPSTMERE